MSTGPRYAIYWVPAADHALWRAGCAWLGRDPEQPHGPRAAGLRDDHRAQPRRYGFHATLKAPMHLAPGSDGDDLSQAIQTLARAHAPFRMPALAVATLHSFVALRPRDSTEIGAAHPLRRLADACVRDLDGFRAPPGREERAHRAARTDLGEDARRHLARWGYPWVFDSWRFHMTLTDDLPDDAPAGACRARLVGEAQHAFGDALAGPLEGDAIALFVEDAPGAPFRLARRFALAA